MSIGFNPDGLGTQTEIIQIDGQFFERKTNILNGTVEDIPINLNLSPTRDPREALSIQKNNEAIEQAKKALLFAPIGGGTLAVGRYAAPKIPGMLKGIRDIFVKRKDLQVPPKRVLEEGVVKTIPGAILPGAGGFGLTPSGAAVAGGVGTTGAILGLDQLVAGETPDVRTIENIDMSGLESDADSSKIDEAEEPIKTIEEDETDTGDVNNIGNQDGDDGESQEAEVRTTADVGVPRFVDPSRMLDFARNVSLGLLQEGQIGGGGLGSGLGIGTQLAVTERQKKDLLAEQQKREEELLQEEFEMKKEIAAASGTPSLDIKEVGEQSTKLRDEIDAFNATESARGLIDASIFILNEAVKSGEKLTGVGGFYNKLGDQLQALANQEEGFLTQSARTQIDKLSEIVRTGNAREILDDPRLSNYEREIIGDVFGELKTLEDPSVALAKFTRARDILVRENKNAKSLINTLHKSLIYGGALGQESYITNTPEVQRIFSIDLDLDSSAATLARLISGQATSKNVISLEGPRPSTQ
tara:strand:+ start:43 stop:1626 length:1584 start_codon:yes stop_codon:yes gene_type:complete